MTQKSISKTTVDKNGLTEEEYLLRYNSDKYPKPALTADICVFLKEKLLLIRRKNHPFIHHLALPGGFANKNEPIEETALRELKEETGLDGRDMKLIGVYSRPGRDPRGWTVSAAYMYEISEEEAKKILQQDAIHITLDMARGDKNWTVWTCDFSFDYVKINADYRT